MHYRMDEATLRKYNQLLAEMDTALVKALKKRLIDDGLTYRAWLEERVREYVYGKGPSPARERRTPSRIRSKTPQGGHA